ncbi:MAG: Phosphoserine phosphatase RsbU [Syntrophorhabdaceae bacterium PtaU1.Bin034]|nr:MAG: Phosphoserine phosphatase RsbU [Syntrophorhabdaceae bacterium PtaU1.Bin034]
MVRNRGIAFKLILLFVSVSGFIFLCVLGYGYFFSRKMIEKNAEESAKNLALATVNRIETNLRALQKIPYSIKYLIELHDPEPKKLMPLLQTMVKNNREVYGCAVAFEPFASPKNLSAFSPYFYKIGDGLGFTDLGNSKAAYFLSDWYQIPKELDRPDWSEPYYAEASSGVLMSTYSVPFYKYKDGASRFAGVVTADISLEKLQEIVSSLKILHTGYAFLISQNGMIVTHPKKELIMNETIFGLAEEAGDERLRQLGRRMIRGESGFIPLGAGILGKECFMYYAPIPSNDWSLAVLFPRSELMADVKKYSVIMAILMVVGLSSLSFAIVLISRSITGPLRRMAEVTERMAEGDLDAELPVIRSGDEVGVLAKAFEQMRVSLKEYIRKLTETMAAKQRIESELKIAHDIQMSILPKMFPPFPDRPEFDIYAVIEPAKEVGGDFYDFFFVDDTHICLIIADVSDKGVPASLFMAVTKTLIKAKAGVGSTPGEILTRVNQELSKDNDTNMFVTVFFAILDVVTGEVNYANGGHNPPVIMRRDGTVTFMESAKNPMVGVIEGVHYTTLRLALGPGEAILMYTDGVTEAINGSGHLFGEERLIEEVRRLSDRSLEGTIKGLKDAVGRFSTGVPQSDDITIMGILFSGPSHRHGNGER